MRFSKVIQGLLQPGIDLLKWNSHFSLRLVESRCRHLWEYSESLFRSGEFAFLLDTTTTRRRASPTMTKCNKSISVSRVLIIVLWRASRDFYRLSSSMQAVLESSGLSLDNKQGFYDERLSLDSLFPSRHKMFMNFREHGAMNVWFAGAMWRRNGILIVMIYTTHKSGGIALFAFVVFVYRFEFGSPGVRKRMMRAIEWSVDLSV